MSATAAVFQGFAYGEHLEGPQRRSLGYRLLAPAEPEPWSAEVETLARRLHAAPYPDFWPQVELFCSALLGDGRRLVAVARYGLVDHTASQRRGGLELIGVVGPGSLGVPSALAVYHWLRQRRAAIDDVRKLGGQHALADVLAIVPPAPAAADPVPVLPIRIWHEGVLLFAATAPSDPDHRLALLEQGSGAAWQWLPLVGPDFPLSTYARRGPLVAWTPHLAGVAVKLEAPQGQGVARGSVAAGRLGPVLLGLLVIVLGAANLWATFSRRPAAPPESEEPVAAARHPEAPAVPPHGPAPSGEHLVRALHHLLQKEGSLLEMNPTELSRQYERLAARDAELKGASADAKELVVTVHALARRNAGRVETLIRKALADKGYDPQLIDLACQKVRDQWAAEVNEGP